MNRKLFLVLQGIVWAVIFIIIVIGSGCSSMTAEFGSGGGVTTSFSKAIQNDGKYIELVQIETRIGAIIPLSNSFDLQLAAGPNLTIPVGTRNNALGLDSLARVYYNDMYPRPYVGFHIGATYMFSRWKEQATDWGFTLGGLLGTEFEIDENSSILVEYRFWHESNGSKIFGSERPNPGANADTVFVLYMIKW